MESSLVTNASRSRELGQVPGLGGGTSMQRLKSARGHREIGGHRAAGHNHVRSAGIQGNAADRVSVTAPEIREIR